MLWCLVLRRGLCLRVLSTLQLGDELLSTLHLGAELFLLVRP